MDLLWIIYGAIVGVVGGTLYGALVDPSRRLPRGPLAALVTLAAFAIVDFARHQFLAQVPGQFWIAALLVGWFALPIGQRFRDSRVKAP